MPYGTPERSSEPVYTATVVLSSSQFTVNYAGNPDTLTVAQRDAQFQEILDFLATNPDLVQVVSFKFYQTQESVSVTP